jgi:two-component system cell cycle response regulator
LQKNFRGFDYSCRLDAENFAVLIPDGDVQACRHRVNEIAVQFKSRVNSITGLSMSLSCGISSFPANGATFQDLTTAAESALRQAKQNGRDQIVIA